MQRFRGSSSRLALWLFALALLLRAAMPFLADASAERRGLALAEVCSVYGVAPASHDTKRHGAPTADHAGEHCALTALGALGTAGAHSPGGSTPATPTATASR